jgi:conjugal transfer/type IV secretion protein DotA/TraY
MKSLLYLILLFISPDMFAGIFDPPPSDESVRVLGLIFGSNIGNVYLGGAPNPVMSAIMEKFNFIIVTAGTLVVAYVVVLSVINTAQEGTAMGKKWSAVWVPMRSIAGMSLMIPTPASGYSMIQMTVIWIIIQGIGAADQIWNMTLDGLKSGASVTMGVQTVAGLDQDAEKVTENLLAIAICIESLKAFAQNDPAGQHMWLNQNANYIKGYTDNVTVIENITTTSAPELIPLARVSGTINFGVRNPNDPLPAHTATCGKVSIDGTARTSDYGGEFRAVNSRQEQLKILERDAQNIFATKVLAINSMMSILQPLAEQIVKGNIVVKDRTKPLDPPGYKNAAIDAYKKLMSGLIVPIESLSVSTPVQTQSIGNQIRNAFGENNAPTSSTPIADAIKIGQQKGWLVAGSYYFVLNKSLQTKTFENISVEPSFSGVITCDFLECMKKAFDNTLDISADNQTPDNPTLKSLSISIPEAERLYDFLAIGTYYLEKDATPDAQSLQLSKELAGGGSADQIIKALAGPMEQLTASLIKMLSGTAGTPGGDVLLEHAHFGRNMMLTMEGVWFGVLAVVTLIGISTVVHIPFTTGPAAMFWGMLLTVLSVVLPLIVVVWTMGAGLAIYAPLIPFMIFTVAAVGWLLTVVEAVIAAPLVALSLVTPAGDEIGKLETGLMILSNIFLRPMLMIFGFLLAGRLFNGVVSLIEYGMLQVFNTISVQTIFSSVVIMFAYIAFIIGMTNTCFSLIYAVPDKIMRWIGGHPEQTDVSAVQHTKQAFNQASGEIAKGMGDTGSMAASKLGNPAAKQLAGSWANTTLGKAIFGKKK